MFQCHPKEKDIHLHQEGGVELLDSNNQEKNIWLTLVEFLFLRITGQFRGPMIALSALRFAQPQGDQINRGINTIKSISLTRVWVGAGVSAFNESSRTSCKHVTFNRLLILNSFV